MTTRRICQRALKHYGNELAKKPNVCGLGITPTRDGTLAVTVYVVCQGEEDAIPTQLVLNDGIEVPVQVVGIGQTRLEGLRRE